MVKVAPSASSGSFSVVTLMLASGVHHPLCFQMGVIGSDIDVGSRVAVLLVNAADDLSIQALGWESEPRSQRAGTARRGPRGLSGTGSGQITQLEGRL